MSQPRTLKKLRARIGALVAFLQNRSLHLMAAMVSGVAYFVGFCGYEQWYLAWVCLAPVLLALADPTLKGREAFAIAWTFGWVTHLGGYPWIVYLLRNFAYLPLPAALLGYMLLCAAQGAQLAVWGWGVNRLLHRFKVPITLAAPVMLVVAEWLYPLLFPSYLSNSQFRQLWFIQTLDVWGPLGLSFILALSSALLAAGVLWVRGQRPFPTWALVAAVMLVGGSVAYGAAAIVSADDSALVAERRVKVGVVQANMGIYEKTRQPREGLMRHRNGSIELQRQKVDVLIWPESAYYYPINNTVENVKHRVLGPLTTPVLFGALRIDESGERPAFYNSAFLADREGELRGHYDKNRLLAFGEYIPLTETFPWLLKFLPEASNFNRGEHQRPLELDGIRYGVLICYEDVIPEFVREVMQHQPHVLVNLTNDAWFGPGHEPKIHLALAAFRAVESRRYLVRSTNTGISAVIDSAGRILKTTPMNARANLVHDVPKLEGTTLYTRWGNWVGWLALGGLGWWLRHLPKRWAKARRGGDVGG